MGRYEEGSDFTPLPLYNAMTLADLNANGRTECCHEQLNKVVMPWNSDGPPFLRTCGEIPSGPSDVCNLHVCIASLTSANVNGSIAARLACDALF